MIQVWFRCWIVALLRIHSTLIVSYLHTRADASGNCCRPGPSKYSVGDRIRNVCNLSGTITQVYGDGTYAVLYHDGRSDDPIAERNLHSPGNTDSVLSMIILIWLCCVYIGSSETNYEAKRAGLGRNCSARVARWSRCGRSLSDFGGKAPAQGCELPRQVEVSNLLWWQMRTAWRVHGGDHFRSQHEGGAVLKCCDRR